MKFDATYGELFSYNNDLSNFAVEHPAVSKMLSGSYERWENQNNIHLTAMRQKLADMYEENVRMIDGVPQFKKLSNGELELDKDNNPMFDFKSSEHEKSFTESWTELMLRPCTIIIGQ